MRRLLRSIQTIVLVFFLTVCLAFFTLFQRADAATEQLLATQSTRMRTRTAQQLVTSTPTLKAVPAALSDVMQYVDRRVFVEGYIRETGYIEGDGWGWYLTLHEDREEIGKPGAKTTLIKVKEEHVDGVRLMTAQDDKLKLAEVVLIDAAGNEFPVMSTNAHVRLSGTVYLDLVIGQSEYRESGKPVIRVDTIFLLP